MDDITKLKHWIDSEFTIIHILLYIIIGIQLGGRWWFVTGVLIFVSIVYMLKRTLVLPRDYLKIKKEHEQCQR